MENAMPATAKPAKPRKDYPLTAHANGQWCKKIRGKVHFFGRWADPEAALAKYLDERDDLQAGRTPRRLSSGSKATTADIVNLFLDRCRQRVESGQLAGITFQDYLAIGKDIVEHLGRTTDPEQLRPLDFAAFRAAAAKRYGAHRLSKTVTFTRMVFTWAFESEHLDRMPRFGPDFGVAGKKAARLEKAQKGKKLLTRDELLKLLAAADPLWKAIVLLAINGGIGNSDIARIKLADPNGEWLDLPRGKTGTERRIWLWPETRKAIQDWLPVRARRNVQPEAADLLFVSKHGGQLIRLGNGSGKTDLTAEGFRRTATAAGIHRPGMGLYWLRHTFQTIADGSRDPVAVSHVMGHIDGSMAGNYREHIEDARLKGVCEYVRQWLWPEASRKAESNT